MVTDTCYCATERAKTGMPCAVCEDAYDARKRPPEPPVDWAEWHEVGIDRHGVIGDRTPCGVTRCDLCTNERRAVA